MSKKTYPCYFCLKTFTVLENMKSHLRRHTHEYPWRCSVCVEDKVFTSKLHFETHMQKHSNTTQTIYKRKHCCVICKKIFPSGSKLVQHKVTSHKKPVHKCLLCPKVFVVKSSLLLHLKSHTGEKGYFCYFCSNVSYASISSLISHLNIHHLHEKPYKCSLCNFRTNTPAAFGIHEFNAHQLSKRIAKCKKCGKKMNKLYLKGHMRNMHKEKSPNFLCYFCKEEFHLRCDLRVHLQKHTGEKHQKCSSCDFRSWCIDNIKTHVRLQHKPPTIKCNLCDKMLHNPSDRTRHVFKEHILQDGVLVCYFCKTTRKHYQNLKTHIHTYHTMEAIPRRRR